MKKAKEVFFCLISLCICTITGVYLIFGDHQNFSEEENRSLQLLPKISLSQITNGKFFYEANSFCSDQFPARTQLYTLSSYIDISSGKHEIHNVLLAKEGYLVSRHDYASYDVLKKNLTSISDFLRKCERNNTSSHLLVAPRSVDVMKSKLPISFPKNYGSKEYRILVSFIANDKIIQTVTPLKKFADKGEEIWYKTDHHWTTLGAYRAYEILSHRLDIIPYSENFFELKRQDCKFYGTTYSKVLLPYCEHDTITLYRYNGDTEIEIYDKNHTLISTSFYDMTALNQKDKYSVFLSGNTDLLKVRTKGGNLPKLLLIKDSFANSTVPFLALHYDMDIIDLRYYKSSISSYISENQFDEILVFYGIDTLATDSSCNKINK